MLTKYSLRMPGQVFSGEDALESISAIIRERSFRKIALFTDKTLERVGLVQLITDELDRVSVEYSILDGIPPEPSYLEVQQMIDQVKPAGADLIIACGGGSVMDCAKLASVLLTERCNVKTLLDTPTKAQKAVPTLMIPSTAGTGAEATPNAIVAVPEKALKVGIVHEALLPDYVILDARLIEHLPLSIAGATGVDALCHAVECFTSKKANPFSDFFALEACDLIFNHIVPACLDKSAMESKRAMQLAAFYGGAAITSSGTTGVHALSYPLGGKYHIAHGVSNAILLCPVMRFNEPAIQNRLAAIYDRVCHSSPKLAYISAKSAYIIHWMEEIVKALEIPASLKAFQVPESGLDSLVASGMEVTRLLVNNAREITPEDARRIYQEIL